MVMECRTTESANKLNPNNPADANVDSDGDVVIGFPPVLGKTYRLEQASDPLVGWSTLSDNTGGTADMRIITDVEAIDTQSRRFYRVVTP